jgi:hypothetical protein
MDINNDTKTIFNVFVSNKYSLMDINNDTQKQYLMF